MASIQNKEMLLNSSRNINEALSKTIYLYSNIYSLKAVKRAVYDLSNKAEITMEYETGGKLQVTFCLHSVNETELNNIIRDFRQKALDHQILIELEEDYKIIRQLIITQAFYPCENLEEIVDALEL